jgi:hypothetical protein
MPRIQHGNEMHRDDGTFIVDTITGVEEIITGTGLASVDNADGTVTLSATGGPGGSGVAGDLPFVYANFLHPGHAIGASALSMAGSGGTVASPILLGAALQLDHLQFFNRATSGTHTVEWRLYESVQSASAGEISGANGSLTYSPTATSYEIVAATGAPVDVPAGLYWLVFRLSSATSINIGGIAPSWGSTGNGTHSTTMTQTLGTALGSTIDFTTGWTKTTSNMPALRLDGRVFGESSGY